MLIALAVLVAASQAAAVSSADKPVLGFNDCNPVLFTPLGSKGLTVAFSKVEYDKFGGVATFVEDISVAGGPSIKVEVSVSERPKETCSTMRYTAVVSGRVRQSAAEGAFKSSAIPEHIGFALKDLGGAVVIGQLEGGLKTNFSYDSFGRRQLAKQSFTLGGEQYEVTYSAVAFDKFGYLSGYEATLAVTPKK